MQIINKKPTIQNKEWEYALVMKNKIKILKCKKLVITNYYIIEKQKVP